MLSAIIPLMATMKPFYPYIFNLLFALCFLCTVPFIIDRMGPR